MHKKEQSNDGIVVLWRPTSGVCLDMWRRLYMHHAAMDSLCAAGLADFHRHIPMDWKLESHFYRLTSLLTSPSLNYTYR